MIVADFRSIRSVIQKYVKYPIPTPPAPIPVIEISSIKLERVTKHKRGGSLYNYDVKLSQFGNSCLSNYIKQEL